MNVETYRLLIITDETQEAPTDKRKMDGLSEQLQRYEDSSAETKAKTSKEKGARKGDIM